MHPDTDESVGRDIHGRGDEIEERDDMDETRPEPRPENPTCDEEDWADKNLRSLLVTFDVRASSLYARRAYVEFSRTTTRAAVAS